MDGDAGYSAEGRSTLLALCVPIMDGLDVNHGMGVRVLSIPGLEGGVTTGEDCTIEVLICVR